MNRMVKRIMVVLVSALMFIGTITTPVQAKGPETSGTNGWNPWGWFWGWGWSQPTEPEPAPAEEEPVEEEVPEVTEEPVVEEETPVVEEEVPEEVFLPIIIEDMPVEGDADLSVSINAPEGAFPAGTEVYAKTVPVEEVQQIIDASENVEGTVLAAVDITFMFGDVEMQPANDQIVSVLITAKNLIADAESLDVVHIDSETEEAESVGLINIDNEEETVSFDAASFSIYSIIGEARTITAHYGFMDGNTFIPFDTRGISSTSTSYPTNGINQNQYNTNNPNTYLVYDFPGYTYKETRLSTATGEIIWPVLHRADTDTSFIRTSYNWQYTTTASNTDDTPSWTTFTNNNNNVYIIYEAKVITQGIPVDDGEEGGEGGQQDVPELPAGKSVESNGDGTYDITLSVTGKANEIEDITKASVIVIFDTSNSMNNNMAGGTTTVAANRRVNIAKTAVNELAETLLNITDKKTGEHLVQMALITFDDTAQIKNLGGSNYTTTISTYQEAVNDIEIGENGDGATNWEDALLKANSLEVPQDAPTYVIFVSDGDPTFRKSRMNDTDNTVHNTTQMSGQNRYLRYIKQGLFGTGRVYLQAHYDAALRVAREIKSANKEFYTVGLSSEGARMRDLAVAVEDASHYFAGNSPAELSTAFEEIASAVRDSIGYTDVEIDDGVTELTTVEAEALTGTPENFIYRKGTNSDDPTQNEVWEGAPEATITNNNHVIWDVASIGTLEDGVTYSVTFTVWPSQESYDIIADINNGIIRDAEGNIIRTGTPAEAYAAQPEDIRKQIGIVEGVYTLLTNTGANVSYKYNGVEDGNEVTVKKEGSMPLDTSYFGIKKEWQNLLPQDSRTAQVLTKLDEADGKYYLINSAGEWILDEEENRIEYDRSNIEEWQDKAVYYIDLIVTAGNEDYTEVRLTSDTADGQSAWTWDQMFIAPGVITHDPNAESGEIHVRETGHEYSVREKPSDAYYWELTAEIYHPMVINGVAVVLQEVTENAPEMTNNTFDGDYYCFDNTVYHKLGTADEALITAINHRRSYLNLTKVVESEEEAPDAFFQYSISIVDPNGEDLWFSAFDPEIENEDGTKGGTVMDLEVTGATAEDGNTGFWYVPSGQTFTIKIKAGWNVRFTNLVSGTEYEITEVYDTMEDGFVLDTIEATAEINHVAQEYNPDIENPTISGEIENPNTDYTITYTNNYLGNFYVYHSSDNTVEQFPMAEEGVKVEDFNIFELTRKNTLYGGYYNAYKYSDQTKAWTDNWVEGYVDESGTAAKYEGDKSVWTAADANTVDGTAMDPESGKTYYLKEVPVCYLRPYTHYTYYKSNNKINYMWFMSGIDDSNYRDFGYEITVVNSEGVLQKADKASASLTITNNGGSVKITAKSVYAQYKMKNDAYLAYYKNTYGGTYVKEGNTLFIRQYWKTPDGINVFGNTTRKIEVKDGVVGNMTFSDEVK